MLNYSYIVDIKRTPIGKFGGGLKDFSAPQMMSHVIKELLSNSPDLKNDIDEVIVGNALPAGIGQNPARIASINSGLSNRVPAFTVNKVCGSGLKSVILATQAIQCGDADIVVAGGMECMSRVPYYADNYRWGVKLGDQTLKDGMIYDGLFCSLIGEHMGVTAENLARKYHISRQDQDEYALQSHQKAIQAIDSGRFNDEIVSIIPEDEQPRRDTSIETLKKLNPVFKKGGTVTPGNASSLNDNAAGLILVSEKALKKYNLKPKATIKNYSSVGLNPDIMGMGAFYAAKKCISKAGLSIKDINLWELNEAFASQSLAVQRKLKINANIVNVNGGAIALGHPIGASGARVLTTLVYELKRRGLQYGLASLCIGGGQGVAMLIENI